MPNPPSRSRDAAAAAAAAVVLGAVSTFGDWVWARYIPDGAVLPGVAHGVVFFLLLAVVLGRTAGAEGASRRLLLTLPFAGLALAAVFYPLAGVLGYLGALLATWLGMWLILALLERWARNGQETTGVMLARGAIAALTSGLAFWSVSGMWTAPAADTGYPLRLVYWTIAFLPGLLALLLGRRRAGRAR